MLHEEWMKINNLHSFLDRYVHVLCSHCIFYTAQSNLEIGACGMSEECAPWALLEMCKWA